MTNSGGGKHQLYHRVFLKLFCRNNSHEVVGIPFLDGEMDFSAIIALATRLFLANFLGVVIVCC